MAISETKITTQKVKQRNRHKTKIQLHWGWSYLAKVALCTVFRSCACIAVSALTWWLLAIVHLLL